MVKKQASYNIKDIKRRNRMLVLKLIATGAADTRVKLAKETGLSKMAVGNIVSELVAQNIVEESPSLADGSVAFGRPPIVLKISENSPKICGMLIKRGLCQILISDLSGRIIKTLTSRYDVTKMRTEYLIGTLEDLYHQITKDYQGKIVAVGISSIGPLNALTGEILNPPDFYGISNLNVTEIVKGFTGLPTFLINDANAGALAEKLYGSSRHLHDFIYLHMMNGIGSGLVLEDKLYNGGFGQSGEIGHTSINFCGPKCSCGNVGCLDLYANIGNMKKRCRTLSALYPDSQLRDVPEPKWEEFVDAANEKDPLAIAVLDEFCGYVSSALINALNLLDVSIIIVGYNSNTNGHVIEDILSSRISTSVLYSKYREVKFIHSSFSGDAPLIGSIAVVADKIFNLQMEL